MGSLIPTSLVAFSIRWIIEYVCSAFVTLCAPAPVSWPFYSLRIHTHIYNYHSSFQWCYCCLLFPFFHSSFTSVPIAVSGSNPSAHSKSMYTEFICRQNIGNALRTLVCMYNFTHISGSIRNNIMNVSCSNVELATYSISSERPFSQKLKPNNAHRITMKNKDGEWREVRRSEEKRKELRQLQ